MLLPPLPRPPLLLRPQPRRPPLLMPQPLLPPPRPTLRLPLWRRTLLLLLLLLLLLPRLLPLQTKSPLPLGASRPVKCGAAFFCPRAAKKNAPFRGRFLFP